MAMLNTHVPCSEANWRLFKLPISGYNFFASLGFICLWIAQTPKNFPYQQISSEIKPKVPCLKSTQYK